MAPMEVRVVWWWSWCGAGGGDGSGDRTEQRDEGRKPGKPQKWGQGSTDQDGSTLHKSTKATKDMRLHWEGTINNYGGGET